MPPSLRVTQPLSTKIRILPPSRAGMHGLAVESTLLLAKKDVNQNHNGTLGDPTQSSGMVLFFYLFLLTTPLPLIHITNRVFQYLRSFTTC